MGGGGTPAGRAGRERGKGGALGQVGQDGSRKVGEAVCTVNTVGNSRRRPASTPAGGHFFWTASVGQ